MAGSGSRGAAGENVLARALAQLPPDLLETNAAFGGRVVEYALRLPGGRLLPIDSKWTSVAELERLETTDDPAERRRLREQVAREVRLRAREMAKYLDPERTLALAVLAVPDAVHAEVPEAHAEGWREGVLVVPYSLALPFVLSLYRLAVRFGSAARHRRAGGAASRGSRSCCGGWTTRSRGGSPAPSSRRETPATPCAATWPRPAAPRVGSPGLTGPGRKVSLAANRMHVTRHPRGRRPRRAHGPGRPKAFLELAGQALLLRSARVFEAAPSVGRSWRWCPRPRSTAARELLAPCASSSRWCRAASGGRTRSSRA